MACNSCSKSFSLLRREKGCPSCGFSYCSDCLKYKIFVPKLTSEAKVCVKCERASKIKEKDNFEPPDAYYKRIGIMDKGTEGNSCSKVSDSLIDKEISNRLQKLKEGSGKSKVTNEDIANRLVKIKGEIPSTSDAELQLRLANIRGVPVSTLQTKAVPVKLESRTEQEQVDDLMKQYMEQTKIDGNYQDDFKGVIDDIQVRLQKLKNTDQNINNAAKDASSVTVESDNEDVLKKILEEVKLESKIEQENSNNELEELPFCEICNEDAEMRCRGCKYLFCKQCFMEHKDEDDGCDKYDPYKPPKSFIS